MSFISNPHVIGPQVGKSGELRALSRIDRRVQKADLQGFLCSFLSKYYMKGLSTRNLQIEVAPDSHMGELTGKLFGEGPSHPWINSKFHDTFIWRKTELWP
ncbi:MAG: hypothetical protein R2787_17245 [Saprospiraceae bacterium]